MKQSNHANTTEREFLDGLKGNSVKAVGEISLRSSVLEINSRVWRIVHVKYKKSAS